MNATINPLERKRGERVEWQMARGDREQRNKGRRGGGRIDRREEVPAMAVGGLMLMLMRSMQTQQSRERARESGGAIFNSVSDPCAGVTTAKVNIEPMYCIVKKIFMIQILFVD